MLSIVSVLILCYQVEAIAKHDALKQMADETASVYFTSSRCIDDGVIDPRDSRTVLSFCLDVIHQQPIVGGNTFGISRL
jgi:acetyl-CoA carboxylase carboxyltransferase component